MEIQAARVGAFLVLLGARLTGGESAPALIAGPYLTGLGPDRVTVSWETNRPMPGRVEYYVDPANEQSADAGPAARLHHVTLTGLPPATVCAYRVHFGEEHSPFYRFTTAPGAPAAFRFAAYGDSRTYPKRHLAVAQAIEAHRPAFVVHTGDLVTDGMSAKQWPKEFFEPARELLGGSPIVPTMGTHERNAPAYFRYFRSLSAEPWLAWVSGEAPAFWRSAPAWLTWTYGEAEFFVINSYASVEPDSPQRRWLAEALAASRARWKIALFHEPLYSSGRHGGSEKLRQALLPLFFQHGLDLVLVGHDHTYERTVAIGSGPRPSENALVEVVTGGGGASLHKILPGPWTARAARTLNFSILSVGSDELTGVTYDETHRPVDWFVLSKRDGRRNFGEAIAAESLEFLLAARRFGGFVFTTGWGQPPRQPFAFNVRNPYASELHGELTWDIHNKAWTIDPPTQTVRIPSGGKAEVAFTVTLAPTPEAPAAEPVPMAILTSGGHSVSVPGFALQKVAPPKAKPRAKAPVP